MPGLHRRPEVEIRLLNDPEAAKALATPWYDSQANAIDAADGSKSGTVRWNSSW